MRRVLLFTLTFGVLAICAARAQDADALRGLHVLTGTQTLPRSHSTFAVPRGASLVVGNDAVVANDRLMDGSTDAEAVLVDGTRTLYVSYVDVGFIASDDWSTLNAETLLSEIRAATSVDDAARSKAGYPTMYVDRWITPPRFDARRAIATCMYAMHDSRGVNGDNAVALVLGRGGYELLSMFGVDPNVDADREAFARYLDDFTVPAGQRYEDHASDDKRAPFDLPKIFRGESGGGQ